MLDPMIQALLQRLPQLTSYAIWEKSPLEAREDFRHFCEFAAPKDLPIGKVENIAAGTIPLRSYTPVAGDREMLPAIIYFHGGGFVLGDLDCYDALCRTLANESCCRVISVDYRLAPEHPFPAAVDDSFAAIRWVEDHAVELFVDANRIAVAGDSAGGNLAAVVCQKAKENKGSPQIAFQLLIYPSLRLTIDLRLPEADADAEAGFPLDTRALNWFYRYYVPEEVDLAGPRLSPLIAPDVAGLPPAYIVSAGLDPLKDDAVAYTERLKQAGVAVVHVDYPGMIHGFFSMQGLIPLASNAIAAAAHAVQHALADDGT
jgi:acetyl esterase/lipase